MKKYFFAVPQDLCYLANCLVRIKTNDIKNQNMFGEMLWEDMNKNLYSCSSFVSEINFFALSEQDIVLGSVGGDLESALDALNYISNTHDIENNKINIYEYEDLYVLLTQINLNRVYKEENI